MEMMVNLSRGDESYQILIKDAKGFLEELKPHLYPVGSWKGKMLDMPEYAKKVKERLPYDTLMKIGYKYGQPIAKGEYVKKIGEGGWYTQPSLATNFALAGSSRFDGSLEKDGFYVISFKGEKGTPEPSWKLKVAEQKI